MPWNEDMMADPIEPYSFQKLSWNLLVRPGSNVMTFQQQFLDFFKFMVKIKGKILLFQSSYNQKR